MAQGGMISPVLLSLHVNDTHPFSHLVELALYADETAIISTSRKPTLLVSYLETYLNYLQQCLSEWRIAINVPMSNALIFARAGRRFTQPRPVMLFGEPIQFVDTARYLGVTLYSRLTWSSHIDQVRRRTAQRMGVLGSLLNSKSDLSVRNGFLLSTHPPHDGLCVPRMEVRRPHPCPEAIIQVSSPCYWCPLVRK